VCQAEEKLRTFLACCLELKDELEDFSETEVLNMLFTINALIPL